MSRKNVREFSFIQIYRSVLLTRENVSVSVYIVLHMTKRERLIRYVTLRADNWHLMTDLGSFFTTINLVDYCQEKEIVEFFFLKCLLILVE